jgi:hypothetical protein
MIISLKPGVRITGIRNEMIFAHVTVASIYADEGYDCIVTAGTDGSHSRGSEHYKGDALDYRTRHIDDHLALDRIVRRVRDALGAEFDVVKESTHLHVEFDPKTGLNK